MLTLLGANCYFHRGTLTQRPDWPRPPTVSWSFTSSCARCGGSKRGTVERLVRANATAPVRSANRRGVRGQEKLSLLRRPVGSSALGNEQAIATRTSRAISGCSRKTWPMSAPSWVFRPPPFRATTSTKCAAIPPSSASLPMPDRRVHSSGTRRRFACGLRARTHRCRYGGSELHNVAAVLGGVVAQEALKLLTHQFVPLNNTFVFNGIRGSSLTVAL